MSTSTLPPATTDIRSRRDFLGRRIFLLTCWVVVTVATLLPVTHTPGQQPTLSAWVAVTALVGYFGGLGVLIGAPRTWYATKWGWFWIATNPFGMLAFLLLAGPFPGLPTPKTPQHRLGGVRGFVIAILLSALVDGTLTSLQ